MSEASERELVPLTEREAAEIDGGMSVSPSIIICFPPWPWPIPFPFPDPYPFPGPWLV